MPIDLPRKSLSLEKTTSFVDSVRESYEGCEDLSLP